MAEQTIVCPNCGTRIPLTKALTSQLEAGLRKDYEAKAEKQKNEAEAVFEKKLAVETARLEKQKKEAQAAFERKLALETTRLEKQARKDAERASSAELSRIQTELVETQKKADAERVSFNQKLTHEKVRLETQARKDAEKEISVKMTKLQQELQKKDELVANAQKQFVEAHKLELKINAREKAINAEISRKVEKATLRVEEEITERIEEEHNTRELELEKKLKDAKLQAAEMKRKLDLGSQQTQGEVIEIELEKSLKRAFPDDKIEPIAKGKTGADVLQKIYTPAGKYCGSILWESKNTQNWSKGWLTKLRSDQRKIKAELAVLVSKNLPKDIKHFDRVEGVWVTDFHVKMGVAMALRNTLMEVALLKRSSKGKEEKMELLYDYIFGTAFKQKVEVIVEAFNSMEADLDKERQVMEKLWTRRKGQLLQVSDSVSGMYVDMQNISGQLLPKVKRLELPATNKPK